jgi:hypothetical protein
MCMTTTVAGMVCISGWLALVCMSVRAIQRGVKNPVIHVGVRTMRMNMSGMMARSLCPQDMYGVGVARMVQTRHGDRPSVAAG